MPAKKTVPRKRHRGVPRAPAPGGDSDDVKFLARGLVHDFNNLIGAILGNAALLKAVSEPGSEIESTAATIERAAERAAGLVRQLHQLIGASTVSMGPVDLNESVRETVQILAPTLPPGISVVMRLHGSPVLITGDSTQMHRLLMNLALNARDALAASGEIAIETRIEGKHALLTVSDDGPGIPEEARARIFEPGYTTKPSGKGSGMGLAIVRRIVMLHGGSIEAAAGAAGGSVFSMRFPLRKL
jgi:signal transduction histidine kinase